MKTSISNNIYGKHVAAVFTISTISAVFAGISLSALVSSRLDYCNSLLYNTANKDIAKLQHVQNCLARAVMHSPLFSCIVPLLKSLH